ncbi:MAG: AAA family ATPase [Gemmataceae bacterium]|nr:AAA family ATPase [Gemmataceae bacterium]
MLVPRRLVVQGFRGFREPVEFHFTQPATLLFGENRSGKSSTLNAIEWCLFGDDCIGKQTGIRERIGWIVPNGHMSAADACVELELANSKNSYVIRRTLRKGAKKALVGELELRFSDGTSCTADVAQQRLAQLVKAEFRDFMTTVYQHQEAVRAVLTQEPRERNDAIDRLLGLSVYRNLLDALAKVKAAERQRAMRAQFDAFEQRVQTALQTRQRDLEELRVEAASAGVPLPKEANALARATRLQRLLDEFATDSGLAPQPIALPGSWTELPAFETAARQAVVWLRTEMPSTKEQRELYARQQGLLKLKTDWEQAGVGRDALGRGTRELDVEFGGQRAVAAELSATLLSIEEGRIQLRQANGRAALVNEAIAYLEQAGAEPADTCPLCSHSAPDLLTALRRQWQEKLQAEVATIDGRIQELTQRKKKLEVGAQRYRDLNEQLQRSLQRLTLCRKEIGDRLGRTLGDDDDPLPILVAELEAIEECGRKLRAVVEDKHRRLEEAEQELRRIRLIHGVVHSEEKKRTLEAIQESPPFKALEAARDAVAEWVCDLEAVRASVAAVAHEEAGAKLKAAERTIDTYFRALTRHPAVQGVRLQLEEARGQRNSYEVTDQDGKDLTPILSQGDLNALALAIFLGLASASADSDLGFVMLDDPSQSLGSEHKKQLVKVLDDVAQNKRLLLATMDREFRTLLADHLQKAKTEYAFGEWGPETGPRVTRDNPS